MKKTNPQLIDKKIIDTSKNYAAIYARVSSQKDNNSINAQIDEAKKIINEENLLVYGVYTDHVSGRTVSPQNRRGFGKLLTDAKAGCFKTIVAYKHDRMVRNLKDWIDLKNQLRRLGISVIFSDKTEYISDNSLQGDFLENLMVMVAELEPNNIYERASHGQRIRRAQGVYSSGRCIPFGYERIKPGDGSILKDCSEINIKSYYEANHLESAFVRFIFDYYESLLNKNEVKLSNIKKAILSLFNELEIDNICIKNLSSIRDSCSDRLICKLIEEIIEILKKTEAKDIEKLTNSLIHIKTRLGSIGNITTIVKNTVYGGYMLEDSNTENEGIIMVNDVPKLDIDSLYVPVCNADKIVDFNIVEKVFCHYYLSNIKDKEENYLFKDKIFCDVCGKKMKLHNGLLSCETPYKRKGCRAYSKTNLTEYILNIIIDEALAMRVNAGFSIFIAILDEKTEYLEKQIKDYRKLKFNRLKDYLDEKNPRFTDTIYNIEQNTIRLLRKVAEFRKEQERIAMLKNIIKAYINKDINEDAKDIMNILKSQFISHVIYNSEEYEMIFKNIIKSIGVKAVGGEENGICNVEVNYEFSYSESRRLSKSID